MAFLGFFSHYSEWNGGDHNTATTAARDTAYSPYSVSFANNRAGGIGNWAAATDCWIHFRVYADNSNWAVALTDGTWLEARDSGGRAILLADLTNGVVKYGVSDNGTSFTFPATTPLPGNLTQTDVDIHIQINSGGNNIVTVYHDGVQVSTASTTWSVATGITAMVFNHADTNTNLYYSEVCVADEDTRGLRIARLDPDAVGGETAWTGDYSDITDRKALGAIASATATQRESWNVSAYGGPASPTAVRGVFSQTWATAGATGPTQIDPFLRISSTNYDLAAPVAPDPSIPVVGEWANDPATAAAWLTTAFAALEAGVEAVA